MSDNGPRTFKDIEEALDFAIEKEIEASDFYTEWAEKTDKQVMKEVFMEFAAEEQKHRKLLENIKKGEIKERPDRRVVDMKLTDTFTEVVPTSEMTYQDALRVAIQREQGAIELYTGLAASTGSPPVVEVFEMLVKEETRHKSRLEDMYEKGFMPEN